VERIDLSRVRLVVQLTLLAPDIVEAILGGWVDQRGCRLAAGWEEQCRLVRQLSVSAGGR
jgi:hypothetical protein